MKKFSINKNLFLFAATAVIGTIAALACGPFFPESFLGDGTRSALASPEAYFEQEIKRMLPAKKDAPESAHNCDCANVEKHIPKNELTELREALKKSGTEPSRIEVLAKEYENARRALREKKPNEISFSGDMPKEFSMYLRGAAAWGENEIEAAREDWNALLALPESDRRHRTVWAEYMLGRSLIPGSEGTARRVNIPESKKPDLFKGIEYLQKAREHAGGEFSDLKNLANESLGWEARAYFLADDYVRAIPFYLQQYDDESNNVALCSLRDCARAILETLPENAGAADTPIPPVAGDERTRRVVTAYLLSRYGDVYYWEDSYKGAEGFLPRWAAILKKLKIEKIPDADRLAWIAYKTGDYDTAKKWLALADDASPITLRLRAKFALREGHADTGEILLEKAVALPAAEDRDSTALGELGLLRMARGKFVPALEAFESGGWFQDAAYIAERILTTDELREYVEKNCPKYDDEYKDGNHSSISENLRFLLARRYARADNFDEALKFLPPELSKKYEAYLSNVRKGFDVLLPAKERAEAFWAAATIARTDGMELFGTELSPDFNIWGGSFTYTGDATETRQKAFEKKYGTPATSEILSSEENSDAKPATAATAPNTQFDSDIPVKEEIDRLKNMPPPEKRFHYRYRAADLAWHAASLMPNDDEETARVLNTAGGWIKARDAKAANRFYQALVIRCGNTELGKAAAEKHWFPDNKPEADATEAQPVAEAVSAKAV